MLRRGTHDTQYPSYSSGSRRDWRVAPGNRRRRRGGLGLLGRRAAVAGALLLFVSATVFFYARLGGDAGDGASPPSAPLPAEEGSRRPTEAFCRRPRPPVVCAHGGDSTNHPPNTMEAFRAALAGGAGCAEVDVAASKDGVLFVLHARELSSLLSRHESGGNAWDLAGRPAEVGLFHAAEIDSLQFASGERVARASDVVAALSADGRVSTIILDVKTRADSEGNENVVEMVARTKRLVDGAGCGRKCVVWGKSDGVIEGLHRTGRPGELLGLTVMPGGEGEGLGDPSRLDATSSPAYVATHYESAASVVRWRERTSSSKRVFGWTANTDAITRTLLDAAVDGLVTNFPVKVRSQVEREQNLCQDT
ncbi:glycerophosphodiester phosphodiesterase [Chloropicon roscoffensis]|uniref:glycerophosphodiester phosphodiesterase n=1 Tax=Chloropicon roscoffensis TaxID=1461544 RepID=A0AAX4PLX4_9CHLO